MICFERYQHGICNVGFLQLNANLKICIEEINATTKLKLVVMETVATDTYFLLYRSLIWTSVVIWHLHNTGTHPKPFLVQLMHYFHKHGISAHQAPFVRVKQRHNPTEKNSTAVRSRDLESHSWGLPRSLFQELFIVCQKNLTWFFLKLHHFPT